MFINDLLYSQRECLEEKKPRPSAIKTKKREAKSRKIYFT